MRKVHRWLLDPPARKGEKSVGKVVVGVSTLVMVVILASGLVLWWPRTRRAWKHRLTVTADKGRRRFWYDMHVSVGFYATLLRAISEWTDLVVRLVPRSGLFPAGQRPGTEEAVLLPAHRFVGRPGHQDTLLHRLPHRRHASPDRLLPVVEKAKQQRLHTAK